jgi:LacI family transcriptional regulator
MNTRKLAPSITQKHIAKALGLTQATVSLALRDHKKIPKARRRQIQAAAEKMGYRRNATATTLSHFKKRSAKKPVQATLAWINFWPNPKQLRAYLEFERLWQGANQAAEKFGYRLEEFIVSSELTPSRLEKILESRGIDGILIPPQPLTPDWGSFEWDKFCVLKLSRTQFTPKAHLVTSHQAQHSMLAYEAMRALGYRRIGFVLDQEANRYSRLFKAGFLEAQSDLQDTMNKPFFVLGNCPAKQAKEEFSSWLKKGEVEALFIDSPLVPDLLKSCGFDVPGDIGLAGTTILDIPVGAGIQQNYDKIGWVAVLMLISMINDNDRGIPEIPRETLITGTWVNGPSLPPRKS